MVGDIGSIQAALGHAVSGMQAAQAEIETLSNNVSNARNPDYHRQKIHLVSRAILGRASGVEVANITREIDRFIARDLLAVRMQKSRLDVVQQFSERIQNFFGTLDSDNSTSRLLARLSSALENLSITPSGLSEQNNVMAALRDFTDHMRGLSRKIRELQSEADQRINNSVKEINEKAALITELNARIIRATSLGDSANALKDRRDAAVSALAEHMDIMTFGRPATGEVVVLTPTGYPLVDRSSQVLAHKLVASGTGARASHGRIFLNDADITDKIRGGRLGGLIDMRERTLPNLHAQFDRLASTLRETLNAAANEGSGFPPPRRLVSSHVFSAGDVVGTTKSLSGKVRVAVLDAEGRYVDNGAGAPDLVDIDLQSLAVSQGGVLTVRGLIDAINADLKQGVARLDDGGRLIIESTHARYGVALDSLGRTLGGDNSGTFQKSMSQAVGAPRDSLNVSFGVAGGTGVFAIEGIPVRYDAARDSLIDLATRINRAAAVRVTRPVASVGAPLATSLGLPPGMGRFAIDGVAFAYNADSQSLNDIRDRINHVRADHSRTFDDAQAPLGANVSGDLVINGHTVGIDAADSLDDVAQKINATTALSRIGVVASVVEDNGGFRLVISDGIGALNFSGSSNQVASGFDFSQRAFDVVAATSHGLLTFGYTLPEGATPESAPDIADVTGSLLERLGAPTPVDVEVRAAVEDNRLVLREASSQPIALDDISGTLVQSMGFESDMVTIPPVGSRIVNAGETRNFSHFFGFNDLLVPAGGYRAYASAAFNTPDAVLGATGVLTFIGDGVSHEVSYAPSDTLADMVARIHDDVTLGGQGIKAEIVREGSVFRVRMSRSGAGGFLMHDSGTALETLSVRVDNTGLSRGIRVNKNILDNAALLPRGTLRLGANAATSFEAIPGDLKARGLDISYDATRARGGDVYRVSYDATGGEILTVANLSTGQTQRVDITHLVNARSGGVGRNLTGDQSALISFSDLGVSVTLNKDFDRTVDRITLGNGAPLVGDGVGALTLDGGGVFRPPASGGLDVAGLRALARSAAYDQSTGVLALNFTSPRAGVLHLAATPGLEFSIDGGPFLAAPEHDLDDGARHAITVRLGDSRQVLGTLTLAGARGTQGVGHVPVQVGALTFGPSFIPTIGAEALATGDASAVQAMLAPFNNSVEFARVGGLSLSRATLSDYAAGIVGSASIEAATVREDLSAKQVLLDSLEIQKGKVSGVDVNEELANINILQMAFNAASRVIRVSSDMLDELVNIVR